MKYKVTFYCPDRHITYDGGRQPDKKGVGGGVNARIRLAQSLVSLGHPVELICNCVRDEVHKGVHYLPLDQTQGIETDILIITTSGDKLDITPYFSLSVSSKLKILLIHGTSMPKGVEGLEVDVFYPLSNFVLHLMEKEWTGVSGKNKFVSYRGVIKAYFQQDSLFSFFRKRNNFRLAYSGHPSKGRENALMILKSFREVDRRYHLYIFGNEKLWGGKVESKKIVAGVKNFGTVAQTKLALELTTCNFGIFIQSREEPFGQTIIEAMTAGCIPIASPVGAFPELIRHGENGFLIDGDPNDPATWESAVKLIQKLQKDPTQMNEIRKNAMRSTLDWLDVVRAWEQHWDIALGISDPKIYETAHVCPACSNNMIRLVDGFHCLQCGHFFMGISDS